MKPDHKHCDRILESAVLGSPKAAQPCPVYSQTLKSLLNPHDQAPNGGQWSYPPATAPYVRDQSPCCASSPQLETLLARIYADEVARATFLGDPRAFARSRGLPSHEARALASIDRLGLGMAARSFVRKREAKQGRRESGPK